jgi:PRC-barrel domain
MKLSDLLGSQVIDESGVRVGKVHDVRLTQDGPMIGSFGAALCIQGLLTGPRTIGSRLGLGRPDVRVPWIMKRLAYVIRRNGRFISWERIRCISEGTIYISGLRDELPRA